jgi:hypothetical protein
VLCTNLVNLQRTNLVRKSSSWIFHHFGVYESAMAKQDDYIRYTIRVPAPLYESIRVAAGDKSINAEIVERLYSSFSATTSGITISLEALPPGSRPERVTLGTFLQSLAETIHDQVGFASKEQSEIFDAGPTLLPPDES